MKIPPTGDIVYPSIDHNDNQDVHFPLPGPGRVSAREYYTSTAFGTPSWNNFTWSAGNSLIDFVTFPALFHNYDAIEIVSGTFENWMATLQNNYGIIIKVRDESIQEGMYFSSSDNASINQRPMLSVFYTY